MKFLFTQVIIVILICIFIATLSNLTELGVIGWIVAWSSGHALYKIYKHMHYSFRSYGAKKKCEFCDHTASDFSKQVQTFLFDDATGTRDD